MTYGIKMCGTWHMPYWRSEEIKNGGLIYSKNVAEYTDLDQALFKAILNEELDVPSYAINEQNIRKEFGRGESNELPDACLKQIVGYYKWRKALFKKICGQTTNNRAEALLNQVGADEVTLKYYIPAECNNFSCEEAPYTGGQTEAYIEVTLRR